jgi:uncharacterized protein (DUF885 family)
MDADAEMRALGKEFFDWFVARNPFFATHMGLHEHDTEVPDGSREAELEDVVTVERFGKRLEALDASRLSPASRIDHRALQQEVRLWIFERKELRFWEQYPGGSDAVGGGVFGLFLRDFAPLPQRLDSIAARFGKFPRLLEQHRTRIVDPVKLWVELAVESCQRLPGFLQVITAAGKEVHHGNQKGLEEAAGKTAEALGAYLSWLQLEVLPRSREACGIGEAAFRKLLELRELPLSVEEIYELGWWYLHESKLQLAAIAARIQPGASVAAVKELVKGDHPKTSQEAREFTARAMREAAGFLRARDLCTFPPNEDLKVIETPSFIRHLIPFAAYSNPGRFEKVQQGIYMVTPAEQPEMLREHSYASTWNTAVHEAYPGHHLQLVCANANPSLARVFSSATETVEGWAHYCEDMMRREGFYHDPKIEFTQVLDQAWRACRIIIDVDLHRHKMTFDEAVDFLVRETGMERPGALAEVKRYTSNPGYQLSYLIGRHLFMQLREEYRAAKGAAFTEKGFHDAILYAGSLSYRYLRAEVLGTPL